jgi:catechol 2,3-dioxygenase-like lactoylglutathione lyase family enzyme
MYKAGFDVMLYVTDLGRSVSFYRDVLGLDAEGFWSDAAKQYLPDPPPDACYGVLRAGPSKVAVHTTDEEVRSGGLVIHLEVDDVDAYHARLRAAGHEASDPQDMPWGWRMTFFSDPDGHLFGLYEDRT